MPENNRQEELFSKKIRAGRRTYFFDVKATRSNDYYLTITESKRFMGDDGSPVYEKHKVFLYREDIDNFLQGLTESLESIKQLAANLPPAIREYREPEVKKTEPGELNTESEESKKEAPFSFKSPLDKPSSFTD